MTEPGGSTARIRSAAIVRVSGRINCCTQLAVAAPNGIITTSMARTATAEAARRFAVRRSTLSPRRQIGTAARRHSTGTRGSA